MTVEELIPDLAGWNRLSRILRAVRSEFPWAAFSTYLLCSALCSFMILYRYAVTGKTTYHWLVVPNLFLAWMPFGFAVVLQLAHSLGWRKPAVYGILGLLWLLFFPNAPYLITDIVHLTWVPRDILVYFDVALVALAAFTGLGLGFHSLSILQDTVSARRGRAAGWTFAVAVWALSALGIYLGRVQRWNSWDVLRSPVSVVNDLTVALRGGEPLLLMAVFFAVPLSLYLVFRSSRR